VEKLPTLSTDQKRIVHEVHAYWRKNRRFPLTVALSVPLRKEIDFKGALEGIPWRIISRDHSNSRNEVLKLRIPGLALCPGEGMIVEAFLELLRHAAQNAIESPTVRPRITREHLREVLRDLSQQDFDLVSPIVKDEFDWGGSENPATGEWSREPGLSVIRSEHVKSIDEYLAIKNIKPRVISVPEDSHIVLLREVYQEWRNTGSWPIAPEFIVGYRKKGDAILLLEEIPNRYRREGHWNNFDRAPITLTLDGIAVTGIAEDDLDAFSKMLATLIQCFEASPEDARMGVSLLASNSGVGPTVAARLSDILADEWRVGIELRRDSTPATLKIDERIMDFEGVTSFLDYVKRREDLSRRSGMPKDELEDEALQRAILEVFAKLPEDGSKDLNRTNVLGRPYQAGDLERHLNKTFYLEERARAGRVMKKLEEDGLLVPTYRHVVSPADWLTITPKGRKVLARPIPTSPVGSPAEMTAGTSIINTELKRVPVRIVGKLGSGGSADVFKGVVLRETPDFPPRGENVAVKLTQDWLLTEEKLPETMERVRREGSLKDKAHLNLVRTYGSYEEVIQGRVRPYVLLEFINGLTLKNWIANYGAATLRQFVQFMRPILDATRHLHDLGIIHRDIKPSNIMIACPDLRVVLMDLGIAHFESEAEVTKSYLCMGTWRRAAPEFLFREPPDAANQPAVDIYALGTVASDLITGKEFLGDLKNEAKIVDAVRSILPRVENSAYPEGCLRFVEKMLSKRPSDRPTSGEVLSQLSELDDGIRGGHTDDVGGGDPAAKSNPGERTASVSFQVGFKTLSTGQGMLHRYSLTVSVSVQQPPMRDSFRLKLHWPEEVPTAVIEGIAQGKDVRTDKGLFKELQLDVNRQIFPGETVSLIGPSAMAKLEYQFNDAVYRKLHERDRELYAVLYIKDLPPVEQRTPFRKLNEF